MGTEETKNSVLPLHERYSEDELEKKIKATELPQWIRDLTPEHKPFVMLDYDENTSEYVVSCDGVIEPARYSTLDEAYEYTGQLEQEEEMAIGTLFTSRIPESDDTHHSGMIFGPIDADSGTGRLYISGETHDEHIRGLQYEYLIWSEVTCPAYSENTDDFMAAYDFIDHHPAFWISYDLPQKSIRMPMWETQGNAQYLDVRPVKRDGEVVFHMVHGMADNSRKKHTVDERLRVKAASYEEAVIAVARMVDAVYAPDGTER